MTQKSNAPSTALSSSPPPGDTSTAGGNELVADVKHAVSDVTEQAKDVLSGAAGQARKTAESQIQGGKDRAAVGLESVADALRKTRDQLSSNDAAIPGMTDYLGRAADGVHRVSSYLKNRDLSQVASDVESFARREPALFLGGAFALGLIGSRFLKSSAPPRPSSPKGYRPPPSTNYEGARPYAGTGGFGPPRRGGTARTDDEFGGRPTLPGGAYPSGARPGARPAPLRSAGASVMSNATSSTSGNGKDGTSAAGESSNTSSAKTESANNGAASSGGAGKR